MRRSSLLLAGWICTLLLVTALPALAAPDVAGKFSIGSGAGTDHKPQSKLWFNDGTWWTVMYDGSSQRIWKFDGGVFVPETYPDAAVDSRAGARADVLWDGTYLYVLIWHDTLPRFSQYSYEPSTQTYTRLPGFPVDLPIPGTEVMVFDQDSKGRLWASFELGNAIHVIWTTTPDHLSWNLTGTILEYNIGGDDISTTVAFGGDKVGVLWSDQSTDASWDYGFRLHRDADPPEAWQPLEIVDSGSVVDDHLNVKADADGRLYFASKDLYNQIDLYVREPAGGWRQAASDLNNGSATRPVVEIDEAQDQVDVFFTDWVESPNSIKVVKAPRSTLAFGAPATYLVPDGLSLNNVTGSKHRLSARTGIMAMASSSSSAYWGFVNLDHDTPTVTGVDPTNSQVGVGLQPLLQIRVTDPGMGVRRSSIRMTFDGAPVAPATAGNAHEYLLTWTPAAPLVNGRVYTVAVTAEDYAYPAHTANTTLRFRTEMLPVALEKKINFQPASGTVPSGYEVAAGDAYTLDRGTGWDKTMTLKRAGVNPDVRLDTYVERKNSSSKATWSYDVANGLYRLTFTAGAPDASGKQRIEVEGELLLNNQTTAAGQFLTIADYPVAVRDGRFEVKIGGAGGSTKTQLCFLEFRYDGVAPPPPPPPSGNEPPPRPVTGVVLARSGNDLQLRWIAVTEDTAGTIIAVTRYDVYRGTSPGFLPDRSGHTNRVGVVASTSFDDLGAANAATDLYYIVTAERTSGLESQKASNLGVRRRIVLSPPAQATQTIWMALPYNTSYGNAQGLATSMNGGASGPVVALARVDRETQVEQVYAYSSGKWAGTNFTLLPGEAVAVTVGAPLTWGLIGSESASPAYGFAHHTAIGNLSLLSLPSNAIYTDARSLVQSLNGGSGSGPITKIAWLDPSTARTECYLYFAGAWRGANFPLQPGAGVAVIAGADLPLWRPRLAQP